jgi:SAM-dependent methyltransferase
LALPTYRLLDLPVRVLRKLRGERPDYRGFLFEDLKRRIGTKTPRRVLEIGPKEGDDTRRLATLGAQNLVLVDLPNQRANIEKWIGDLKAPVEMIYGNFMYDRAFDTIEPFDVVWCTGVLYHNPEQLRFVRQLFDLTAPGGILVLETATARLPGTRDANCVEIWYPPNKAVGRVYHVSNNVSHLPSRKALASWLEMLGFSGIEPSDCHRRVTRALDATRAAYLAQRPLEQERGTYYSHVGHEFPIGRAR